MATLRFNHCVIGDCRRTLKKLPDSTFACCVTSPPYFGLRDYGHLDQIGLESTPDEYVAKLVDVFAEVRRVLRDDGTLWLNLGDSYANDGKWGGSTSGKHVAALHGSSVGRRRRRTGLKPKDLIGVPWRVALALQSAGWWLRSDIVWSKPNPMPDSADDRPTRAHEYVFLFAKSERYFYNADAVREPEAPASTARYAYAADDGRINKAGAYRDAFEKHSASHGLMKRAQTGLPKVPKDGKRHARTVWTIPTQPYDGAHFATMPIKLAERCILAGSSLGGSVLDPFMGSGTVGQVAEQLGRLWFGCELSADYGKLIAARTAQSGLVFEEPR